VDYIAIVPKAAKVCKRAFDNKKEMFAGENLLIPHTAVTKNVIKIPIFHLLVHTTQPNILKMNHDKSYSITSILRMIHGNICTQCKRL